MSQKQILELRTNPVTVEESIVIQSPIAYFSLYQARNTLDQIKGALRAYFEALTGEKPENLDKAATEYFGSRAGNVEAYKRDVEKFFTSMKERPPKTIQARLSHVKQFLLRNHIDFGQLYWKDLQRKIRGSRAVTVDEVPSSEDLRKILSQLPVHGRALVLTAASSGARIGELLKIHVDDVNLKTDPIRLTIRAEAAKGGGQRICFASREAREAIQQWLLVRDNWLDAASRKSTFEQKNATDKRLFPLTAPTAHEMYTRALEKAGFLKRDPRTGISTYHFHVLRKLFRTRLGPVLPQDIVECFLGHESYLAQAYRRYSIDQLGEFYRKGEPSLWILSETGELVEQVKETRELLSIQIARLTKENEDLKTQRTKDKDDLETRLARIEASSDKDLEAVKRFANEWLPRLESGEYRIIRVDKKRDD